MLVCNALIVIDYRWFKAFSKYIFKTQNQKKKNVYYNTNKIYISDADYNDSWMCMLKKQLYVNFPSSYLRSLL